MPVRVRSAALALALAAPAAAADLATAADPDGAATTVAMQPAALDPAAATTAAPPAGMDAEAATTTAPEEREDNWLDVGHAFIEHRVFAPVLRVDRFFSDERSLEAERGRSFIRWRQELRTSQYRGTPGYTTTIAANLKLPGINKELRKIQIEIAGQSRDAFTALFPGEHASPAEVPTSEATTGTAEAGLGYRLFETLSAQVMTHGDLGAGVLFQLPPGVYGRARLRFAESLGAKFLAREAIVGFWRTDTRLGTTGSAEVERPLAYSTLARLSGSTTITERSRGYEWGSDLSLLGTLRSRIGAQLGFNISGATKGITPVDAYRFYLRLRRDFYRKWIFLELEPQYGWPWDPVRKRHGEWAVAFRLEIQFQGNEAPRVPAPDEPEPKDPSEPKEPSAPRSR